MKRHSSSPRSLRWAQRQLLPRRKPEAASAVAAGGAGIARGIVSMPVSQVREPLLQGIGKPAGGPFSGIRLHGINVVAFQANQPCPACSVGQRHQPLLAFKTASFVHVCSNSS
jgi:hypothetical protein